MVKKSGAYIINDKIKVHMTNVHTRRIPVRRSFCLILNGLLITPLLLGTLSFGGGNIASASTNSAIQPSLVAVQQVDKSYQDEQALIANLNLAVKAIEENGWSVKAITTLTAKLQEIDFKLTSSEGFNNVEALNSAILETEKVVATNDSDGLRTLKGKENMLNEILSRIKRNIGMESSGKNLSQTSVNQNGQVILASVGNLEPSIVINGVKQSYPQPPVIRNGSTLVPLRGVFELLGAKVEWDEGTDTVTATKDSTEIKLKVGSDKAYINGKQVKLVAPSAKINGFTLVPMRFVAEALGAKVDWNPKTMTVFIEMVKQVTDVPRHISPNGILVLYGKHDYSSRTQKEYDDVIKASQEGLKEYDDVVFGGIYETYYNEYLGGARWSGDTQDRSDKNKGLKSAEDTIGVLVEDGVKREQIEKAYKAMIIAGRLLKGIPDPGDGTPSSAYGALVSPRQSDCDSDSQVKSLVFDILGFNSIVYGGNNHAEMAFEINGKWYETIAGSFGRVDPVNGLSKDGVIISQPTYGELITVTK